ncbi:MAG: aldo-keto reductase [Hydrocarboniphaga sp.]|uniref:aldo/keto reductase n=1 Tax=Hydrocarboniphaga sp. TaxID=2033016 RepID=UPI002607FDA4|nr:aldo/keto reductase [Hydrocarboniphaga sp.]MDB5970030.1 aldo-keto reductase [Hydrocarboniphaga sp.]
MNRVKLGTLEVSEQGLGCMGMSEFRGHSDWDESVATIQRAADLGVTFFDTSDIYGSGHNEVLLGRAVHGFRKKVEIATKFGIDRTGGDLAWTVRGDRAYVRRACEASLVRMETDYIDLYYIHQMPRNAEIEETVGAMAELVKEGKVRAIGLSNVTADIVRRACAVAPIAAVQQEYSMWTREVETITPTMAEFGVGLVPFGPLGRGFLTGALEIDKLEDSDLRKVNPRFTGDAAAANQAIVDSVRDVARRYGVPTSHVALEWVRAQAQRLGVSVVAIPGTKRRRWLEENVAALDLKLSKQDLLELDTVADRAVGASFEFQKRVAWSDNKS